MPEPIVTLNEESLKTDLRELVRKTVEDTLNGLLEEEADDLAGAERYERTAGREAYRAGHYDRSLTTSSGEVTIRMPKLKGVRFTTAIIERYRRRETSVEEAMIEMYLAGVSTRRIEDVSEILWGAGVSAGTVSNLNEKACRSAEERRSRPLAGEYPYVFIDGIYLKRSWGGSYESVSVLVAAGLEGMRLGAAAQVVSEGCLETLTYADFPMQHWTRIRTNNAIERLNREIRRRTRVVGTFPDGRPALMLVTARLKYIAECEWGKRRYLDVSLLHDGEVEA